MVVTLARALYHLPLLRERLKSPFGYNTRAKKRSTIWILIPRIKPNTPNAAKDDSVNYLLCGPGGQKRKRLGGGYIRKRPLIDASVQVNDDVYAGYEDFGGN